LDITQAQKVGQKWVESRPNRTFFHILPILAIIITLLLKYKNLSIAKKHFFSRLG